MTQLPLGLPQGYFESLPPNMRQAVMREQKSQEQAPGYDANAQRRYRSMFRYDAPSNSWAGNYLGASFGKASRDQPSQPQMDWSPGNAQSMVSTNGSSGSDDVFGQLPSILDKIGGITKATDERGFGYRTTLAQQQIDYNLRNAANSAAAQSLALGASRSYI